MPNSTAKPLMIVEDSDDLRDLLTELFRAEGFLVQVAGNGQEALDQLQNMTDLPNLILLDLMMPVMDGFEFRQKQVADPRIRKIPVVVMSADGDVQDKKFRMKARDYLKKPVDVEYLLMTVRKNLAIPEAG